MTSTSFHGGVNWKATTVLCQRPHPLKLWNPAFSPSKQLLRRRACQRAGAYALVERHSAIPAGNFDWPPGDKVICPPASRSCSALHPCLDHISITGKRVSNPSFVAYFMRPDIFTVPRFLALCMGVAMDRFVRLGIPACLLGRTFTPEERKRRRTRKKRSYCHLPKMPGSRYHLTNQTLLQTIIPRSILIWSPFAIRAAKRGFTVRCTLVVNCHCHLQCDLGPHQHGD